MRRVVVTGLGMVTPLAADREGTWNLMLEGASGIGAVTRFDASTLPVRIAGEVNGSDTLLERMRKREGRNIERHSAYALEAAEQAVDMAGLEITDAVSVRFGVFLGAGDSRTPHGPAELGPVFSACRRGDRVDLSGLNAASLQYCPGEFVFEADTMMPAAHVARRFGARACNRTCLTACAAGSQAIGEAFKAIQWGDVDLALAGGAQSLVTLEGLVGFTLLKALSSRNDEPERASRPFDAERDGFVLSEGGAVLLLEELERARNRGAPILAEIIGYGTSADAYRVTDPHPKGAGAVSCMKNAIEDARMPADEFWYVNAHGTSTKANDSAESLAVDVVFGRRIPVTSNKSQQGHLIAAAGAMEACSCVLSIRDGAIPPTINYETKDSSCDVEVVGNVARSGEKPGPVLSNSFGFGGQNVSLVIAPFSG